MVIEDRKVNELPEKSSVEITDKFIIEDLDGTKLGKIQDLKRIVYDNSVFNTVEDMKSANLQEGDICYTLGYYDVNDGGAAKYIVKYAPALVEDKCNVQYLYTSDTLRAIFVSNGTVKPEQFGAHGNGIVDDYKSIKSCIDSGNNVEFVKSHKYKITAPIPVFSNMNINFSGAMLIPYGCDAFQKLYNSEESEISNVTIENVCVDLSNGYNGINIQHPIRNLKIKDVNITNSKLYGIRFSNTKNCLISECVIESPNTITNSIGIGVDSSVDESTDIIMSDLSFKNTSIAILMNTDTTALNYIKVDGCIVDDTEMVTNDLTNFIKFAGGSCSASVSNNRLYSLQSVFNISSKTNINIIGFNMCKDCDCLIDNVDTGSSILLNSNITMITSEKTEEKRKIISRLFGKLYMNGNIDYDKNYYDIIDSISLSASIHDVSDPKSYDKEISTGNSSITISDIRNKFIDIQNVSDIDTINGGINGQRIYLVSSNNIYVYASDTIKLKNGETSIQLDSVNGIELKFSRYYWFQI